MRTMLALVVASSTIVGCSAGGSAGSTPSSIGALATGGSKIAGANASTGGGQASAIAVTAGGTTTVGNSITSGGTVSAGGTSAVAGAQSTGGAVTTGGAANMGGAASTGGAQTTGGSVTTGGAASTSTVATTGGSPSTGGAKASGGSVSTGGSGTGGSQSGCNPGAPTSASGGASYPFPQHRLKSYCIYPITCSDANVATAWAQYKSKYVVSAGSGMIRVQRVENSNDTVSEGIAYGMLFAVYMNEKSTFDGLWAYAQPRFDSHGLMNWQINSSGTVIGSDSATDADEDMGFALVMADKQWGGYTTVAQAFLAKVLSNDFASDGTIKGGDMVADINPSYLAPAFYKVFATYTGNTQWNTVVDKAYQTLASAMNTTTGLVPDWFSGRSGPNYTYDATRTPFRIGTDYCWNGEVRAQSFLQKTSAFFGNIGAANIKDGYTVAGVATGANTNSAFVGPAGVAGMNGSAPQAQLVSGAYTRVVQEGTALTGDYYTLSWALFTNLMMTGNFINMASP
jgi:endo-1,4-beta-D-glucanase Y